MIKWMEKFAGISELNARRIILKKINVDNMAVFFFLYILF